MPRSALIALLALTACPGLPDETGDTLPGTDVDPGTFDPQDTAPPCPEDLLEENDSAASAAVPEAYPVLGQVCEGDEDWFVLEAPGGCVSVVDLSFASSLGDLDLEVYAADDRIAVSSSTTDDEQARFFVEEDTTVQVRVVGFFGAENGYRLDATAECDPCEIPDDFEPNDTPETAVSASFPLMAEACVTDADWYALPAVVTAGCLVDASLRAAGLADGAVELQLFDDSDALVQTAAVASVGTGLRTLGVPGDQLVVTTSADAAYELDAEVTCPPAAPACAQVPADVWANPTLAESVRLRDQVVVAGAVCGETPDWWAVPFQEGCTTVVTVNGDGLTATAFDNGAARSPVTVSGPTPVSTTITPGPHHVRLNATTGDATYTIQADILCGGDETDIP